MLALMAAFILNNFFGTSFTIYSIAPIGWLLVGWISANYSRESKNIERRAVTEPDSEWLNAGDVG